MKILFYYSLIGTFASILIQILIFCGLTLPNNSIFIFIFAALMAVFPLVIHQQINKKKGELPSKPEVPSTIRYAVWALQAYAGILAVYFMFNYGGNVELIDGNYAIMNKGEMIRTISIEEIPDYLRLSIIPYPSITMIMLSGILLQTYRYISPIKKDEHT